MTIRLDHVNLNVRDVDATVRFLLTAFPDWKIRAEGKKWNGDRWLHVGDDTVYLALTQAREPANEPWVPYGTKPGTNHLGFEVDDVAGIRKRLAEGGYKDTTVPNNHPHRRRVYFWDAEGNDWEFVQYLTDDPAKRNDYAIPDGS
jgi:catechol 2,3-dioxygenase-like lactoylglutathione lyase family enzyme